MISLNSHIAVSRNICWLIDDTFSSNVVHFKGFLQLNLMKSSCCAQRGLTCFKLWLSHNIISLSPKTCAIHSTMFYVLTELKEMTEFKLKPWHLAPGFNDGDPHPLLPKVIPDGRLAMCGLGLDKLLWLYLLRHVLLAHQYRTLGVPRSLAIVMAQSQKWTKSQQGGYSSPLTWEKYSTFLSLFSQLYYGNYRTFPAYPSGD